VSLHANPVADGGPQLIVEVRDPSLGELGWVVIDRTVHGTATGGIRMAPGVTPHEVALNARTMTLKWAVINVPMGGAKAGLTRTPTECGMSRRDLMRAFGRAVSPLIVGNVYQPACDLGTDLDDLRAVMDGANRRLSAATIDSARGTALGVFESIRQVASFHRVPLRGLRVAIEGLGKVGGELATLLAQAGAHLVGVSTADGALIADRPLDVGRLLAMRAQHGSALIHHYGGLAPLPHDHLFALDTDLLVPGARTEVIHARNCAAVRAKWIVPIANAPITLDAERTLVARGIVVVPDFLANCGGVLAVDVASHGFALDDAETMIREVLGPLVFSMLQCADRKGVPLGVIARELAWHNHLAHAEGTPDASRLRRLTTMLNTEGLAGIGARLAWRVHRAGLAHGATIRRTALRRSAAWRLAISARRLAELYP
jgi:glutamate dehydrogenase (NAD(P)+)